MTEDKKYHRLKYLALKQYWGFDSFRELQEEIIDAVAYRNDCIALLPTGGGKSLCYQLPAMVLEGLCLVVSPLLALMRDQVLQLQANGIEAEYISSDFDEDVVEEIYTRVEAGEIKILYVSPERLTNTNFLKSIDEVEISFIAVDEAHCISEWGQDFRPSYQNISEFRKQRPHVTCLALTATATPKVLKEIEEKLQLKNPKIFQKSFNRTNIAIHVDEIGDKYSRVFRLIKHFNSSGIVYTSTRRDAENLAHYLNKNGLNNVDYFHAGLSPSERNRKQNRWIKSHNHVLVSTNAFGMGIDKDNVRFVIHFSPSQSIENYYQEIGRCGRDGYESYAFMLWNEQELTNFDNILKDQLATKVQYKKIVDYIYSIFKIADNDSTDETFKLDLHRIKKFTGYSLAKIRHVLQFLNNQEIIAYHPKTQLSTLELKIAPEYVEDLPKKDAYFIELLQRCLPGLFTRKVWFSEKNLEEKMGIEAHLISERLTDLSTRNILTFLPGGSASLKFIIPRNDLVLHSKYWKLLEQIQRNKLQKWEEMKYYLRNEEYCKMRLILSYFGEKETSDCGQCSVCKRKNKGFLGRNIGNDILNVLKQKPAELDEIVIRLGYYQREEVLEHLIMLLDSGKVRMHSFKTYGVV